MSLAFSAAPVNHHNGTHAHSQHYGYNHSMDRGASDYQQSGLPSSASYPSYSSQQQPEPQPADQPASSYQTPSQEVRSTSSTYSSSATPSSEYGGTVSSSSRTPTFPPDYNIGPHRYSEPSRYHPSSSAAGGMCYLSLFAQQHYIKRVLTHAKILAFLLPVHSTLRRQTSSTHIIHLKTATKCRKPTILPPILIGVLSGVKGPMERTK